MERLGKISIGSFVLFFAVLFAPLSIASVSSDVGMNVTIGQAPVLQVSNITIVPEDIPIGNPANFTILVSNIGNIDGNATSIIQIYNGYNVIDTFESDSAVVLYLPPNNLANISVTHEMNYSVGSYLALGYIRYNNKTVGPVYKNFTINRGQPPSVYLVSPLNHSWTQADNNSLEFVFYVDDVDSNYFTCKLYLDGEIVGQSSASKLVNSTILSNKSFTNGRHEWKVECTDNGNNTAVSETWELNTGSFCFALDLDNVYYTLNRDLYSNQTCFTITGNNAILDCRGYSIFFNSGSAIIVGGQNVTVKNCILAQNLSYASTGIQVNSGAEGSNVMNNTLRISGNNSIGIKFLSGDANIINNSIFLHGENGITLYFENSSLNTIQNNYITIDSSTSNFIYADANSNQNSFIQNIFVPSSAFEGFSIILYVDQFGLNTTIPAVGKTPALGIYIPENSVQQSTQLNITTTFIDSSKIPINIVSNQGYLKMQINISASSEVQANSSNPIIFTINASSFNLSSSDLSRLGLYVYNSSSSKWEALATNCNLTSQICNGYLTHFSSYGWIIYIPLTVTKETETRQVPISGMLSCTKEMAQIITEPNASVEVRFLEQPYANSLIKAGKADANGSFVFIADLPGRYQVAARKTGFTDNSLVLTASDDCVPRITFVRRWLECSTSACFVNIPVLTTQMKDVVVDITDVYSIMSGSLTIKDRYGTQINFYSLVGKELRLPLITDNFVVNSQSNVNMRQVNDLANGKVNLTFQTSNTARVSGFILNIGDIGNNYINNITYIADKEYPILRYTVDKNKITVDQQLYLYPNSKFVLSVSPVPLRCSYSYECPSDSICKDGTCTVISCPCGYISNRTCISYECCKDSDCASGKSCISHLCVYTPSTITEEEKVYIADRLNVLVVSIQSAREKGEDTTAASQLLEQARTAYEAGDFEKAKELLAQAQQIFTESIETKPSIPYLAIMTVVVLGLVLIVAYLIISKLSKPRQWKPKKK